MPRVDFQHQLTGTLEQTSIVEIISIV